MRALDFIDSFKPAAEDVFNARIEAALDAGIDITPVIEALDDLAGNADDEDDELDGEGISQEVRITCRCETESVMCC